MKFSPWAIALVASTAAVLAAPSTTTERNPFLGKHFFESPLYTQKVHAAVENLKARGELELAEKATKVAKVSTFIWIDKFAEIPSILPNLEAAKQQQIATGKKQIIQFVVYNLPDRDCSAKASAGELSLADGGEEKYKKFIDDVLVELKKVPDVTVAIQLETDAIGNMVSNLGVEKCLAAMPAQRRSYAYAIAKLQLPNVQLYIDGAHAGWLGWPGNLQPTADVMHAILSEARGINPNAKVRGVATNVSNYNGLGNQEQAGRDELKYVEALAPYLKAKGYDWKFIIDQGRSGNQVALREGGDWCNFGAAGFGPRPTTDTPSPLIDAIVWVKPGGDSDGTSDIAADRYDEACGSATSLKPAPEAGAWFQAHFEQLVENANPPF